MGGIMNFAIKKEICMKCKTLITSSNKIDGTPLCNNCYQNENEIYNVKLIELNIHQKVYNQLWTECQRCQGSFHQEVICSNRDCPIFYKRKKVQIDLQKVQDELDRFTW